MRPTKAIVEDRGGVRLAALERSDGRVTALWFGRRVHEVGEVFLEFRQVFVVQVHHGACLVILVPDVLAEFCGRPI